MPEAGPPGPGPALTFGPTAALRGEAEPARQIANPKLGVVSGHGGHLASHATLILGKDQ